jgi:hypothetical protein
MPIINRFKALVDVKLSFSPTTCTSFLEIPILSLPRVGRFIPNWFPWNDVNAAAGISHLAKSRFHFNCGLGIHISPPLPYNALLKLIPLFQSHKGWISLACPDDAIRAVKDAIKATPTLSFPYTVPPPTVFESGDLPREISVRARLVDMEKLWAFLQELAQRPEKLTRSFTTRLSIAFESPSRFSWSKRASVAEQVTIKNMLPYAFILKEKNIVIIDQDGKEIEAFMA